MKVTIEPEGEEKFEARSWDKVFYLGLAGMQAGEFLATGFSHVHTPAEPQNEHGEFDELLGKLDRVKEYLLNHGCRQPAS